MAASRFATQLALDRADLCAELVQQVTGLPASRLREDAAAHSPAGSEGSATTMTATVGQDGGAPGESREMVNARTATEFCVANLEYPHNTTMWQGKREVLRLYDGIVSKLRTGSQHDKADRVDQCVSAVCQTIEDEGLLSDVLTLLHLLSNAPTRDSPAEEALALERARGAAADGSSVALLQEINLRLTPLKTASIAVAESPPGAREALLDDDWLNASFSDSEGSSGSDWGEDTESVTSQGAEATPPCGSLPGSPKSLLESELACSSPTPSRPARSAAREERAGALKSGQKEANHFNARCSSALLALLERKAEIPCGPELLRPAHAAIIHEAQLVRQTLMVLQGNRETRVFRFDARSGTFFLDGSVRCALAHASHESLASALRGVCATASTLERARRFATARSTTSLVLASVQDQVGAMLAEKRRTFTAAETEVLAKATGRTDGQTRTTTLMLLLHRLEPTFASVEVLGEMVSQLEVARGGAASADACSLLLQRACSEVVEESECALRGDPRAFMAVRLFFAALRPQVRSLAALLEEGRSEDPFSELFIVAAEDGALHFADHVLARHWRPIGLRALQCAKAVQLLRKLSLEESESAFAWPPAEMQGTGAEASGLFSLFEQACAEKLRHLAEGSPGGLLAPRAHYSLNEAELLLRQALFEPVLALCDRAGAVVVRHVLDRHHLVARLEALRGFFLVQEETLLTPFFEDLFNALDRDIAAEHPLVAAAVEAFAREQRMESRIPIGALDPDQLEDDEMGVDQALKDEMLSAILRGDLDGRKHLEGLVSAKFRRAAYSGVNGAELSGVHALDGLQIDFVLQSPLADAVDDASLRMYQALFRFLLQIKRARHALCRLQHALRRRILNEPALRRHEGMHKLSLGLMEHLHFVNNLHAYAMHRVSDPAWATFLQRTREARSLDEVRALHRQYLSGVCRHCLLSPESPGQLTNAMLAVLELLEGSLKFRAFAIALVRAAQTGATEQFRRLEGQIEIVHRRFARTKRFLLIMLSQRSSAGGVRHLEDVLIRLDFDGKYTRS